MVVQQNAGTLIASYITAMQTFADDALIVTEPILGNPEFELVIFHDDTNTGTTVTTGVPRSELATQRRRRLGVGN